eukprot:m.130035 g.130035  ORF g.130035 m.130035 type:complete len:563 (+) comp29452_c0_seq1:101-1789(+)
MVRFIVLYALAMCAYVGCVSQVPAISSVGNNIEIRSGPSGEVLLKSGNCDTTASEMCALKAQIDANELLSSSDAPSVTNTKDGDIVLTVAKDKNVFVRYWDDQTNTVSDPVRIVTEDSLGEFIEDSFAGDGVSSPVMNKGMFDEAMKPILDAMTQTIADLTADFTALQKTTQLQQECHDVGMVYDSNAERCEIPTSVDCGNTIPFLPPSLALSAPCLNTTFRSNCTVICADGYEPASTVFVCGLDGNWNGALKCKAKMCDTTASHTWAATRPDLHEKSGCDDTIAFPSECEWACATGHNASVTITATCLANQTMSEPRGTCTEVCGDDVVVGNEKCDSVEGCSDQCTPLPGYSCKNNVCNIVTSCVDLPDGIHTIYPMGKNYKWVEVVCNNTFYIIDVNRDLNWKDFFTDRTIHNGAGQAIMSPDKQNLIKNRYLSWHEWFTVAGNAQGTFSMSDDCNSCHDYAFVPYTSGNYIGCFWHNRHCDMDLHSNACGVCLDGRNPKETLGACTHLRKSPKTAYRTSTESYFAFRNCAQVPPEGHWWHVSPSIGTNGKNCACYRPKT